MNNTRNARFWVFVNGGQVKITLKPGQTIEHYEGGATDEGWSHYWTEWEHTGDEVVRTFSSEQRDCDGRFDSGNTLSCAIKELRVGPGSTGNIFPIWKKESSCQRDYSAEAMNY